MAIDASARARLLVQEILHPTDMDRFVSACVPTPPADFASLRLRVQAYLAWANAESKQSAAVDLEMAAAIASALLALLDEPDLYPAEERALLRGATDYFLDADDGANDLTNALGFDDDARVLNAVLDALGRRDLTISI